MSEAITYKYVQKLKTRLENAFNKANEFYAKESMRSKQRFDKTAKCSKLVSGDLVLVKRKGFVSEHKIADKWENEPYEIVSQRSDGLPVYTVVRNGRERTLHRNMLFPLGLRCDSESILPNLAEFENLENPDLAQVDNFSNSDGEIDQPVYEGPQTRSCTKNLMKANVLMNNLFDMQSGEICDEIPEILIVDDKPESLKDLILEFWYQQVFTLYCICCDLAEAGIRSIYC